MIGFGGTPAAPFVPSDLASVVCWLDASGDPTKVLKTGAVPALHGERVASWQSRVGAIDFAEVASSGPNLIADGSGPNGRPFLRFNGVDDYLRYAAAAPFANQTGELWMLIKSDAAGTQVPFGTADEAVTTDYWYVAVGSTGRWEYQWDSGAAAAQRFQIRDLAAYKTAWYLLRYTSDGATTSVEVDGFTETLNDVNATGNTGAWFGDALNRDSVTLGALNRTTVASFFAGDIAEVIITNSNLGAVDAAKMRSYFALKFGQPYRAACLGDSLTTQAGNGYVLELATALSAAGRAIGVADHGVGSETLDDMYVRWRANILNKGFARLVLMGGTNNVKNGVGAMIDTHDRIVDEALAAGMAVVVGTIPPFGGHASWDVQGQAELERLNGHLRARYATHPRVRLVDVYAAVKDPDTLQYLPAYNLDLLHWNTTAEAVVGGLFKDALLAIA